MKKTLTLFALLCMASVLAAATWTPTSIPIAHLADSTRYVCNPDSILSQSAVDEIDAIMRSLEDSTGIQPIIAVVEGIDPNDCYLFAFQLGEKNGVGESGKNNGFVLLLCTGERCVQFCTGYGIEGAMPDAICRRIQETYMNPHFANGDWDTGMIEGAKEIKRVLLKEGRDNRRNSKGTSGSSILLIVLAPVFLIVLLCESLRKKKIKCPECGKCKLKKISRTLVSETTTEKTYKVLWECQNCHHTLERIEVENIISSGGSGGGGNFTGGFSGGSHSGGFSSGGSIGGHYGGGHFGGGGAGSRF